MIQIKSTKTLKSMTLSILPLILAGIVALGALSCSGEKAAEEQAESGQLWSCGMHPQVIQDKPGNCPICGMKLTPLKVGADPAAESHVHSKQEQAGMETQDAMADMGKDQQRASKNGKKILYWRAPMDPTYISDKPGKSPMGMDLIPVYEGEESRGSGATVSIDPNVVLNIGVRTAPVEVKNLRREIRTVAHVDYDESTLCRVNIKFSGWIEKLYVNESGQAVQKGEPLLEIYSPELVATQEEYLLAYKNVLRLKESQITDIKTSGDELLRAARQRLLFWDIEERQLHELEQRGEVHKTLTLYAPQNGIVIGKHVEEGMRVVPGMDLYRVADLSKVWVYAHLFEYEIPWVKVGDDAEMELPYIPGQIFKGKVKYIYPYLDKKTRDVKVRLEVPNPNLDLKPEMYVNVRFTSEMPQRTPVVPSEAIIRTGKRNLIFIDLGGGRFEPREVVLGIEGENNQLQIRAGLKGGEMIVTSAQFLLDSESRLQEAIQKMLAARRSAGEQEQGSKGEGEKEK